jgi:cation:H+ antiporter
MDVLLQFIILVIGFIVLIKGADIFVDGASATAENFKVPKMLIGLTIVAFGTSAPEFAVSVKSIISGNTDMLLGNVIGSNILNVLLIVGVAAMVKPLVVQNNTVKKELPIVLLMTLMFATLILDNVFDPAVTSSFSRQDGIVITLAFSIFIYYLISMNRAKKTANELKKVNDTLELLEGTGEKKKEEKVEEEKPSMKLWKALIFTVLGIIAIVVGSDLVVDSASKIAGIFGVPESMIALTIVALGTSLPELVTSVVATKKGEVDLAIGNVVGSNIFNIGIVAGIPVAIFGGIPKISFSVIDLAVMIFSAVFLYLFARDDRRISRLEGAILLSIFVAYYSYVIMSGLGVIASL